MLGKNIGTKIDAKFVNTQYQAYLTQKKDKKKKVEMVPAKAPTKKLKGKAQKHAEMRRKGIFVQADSSEFDNTIMEKPSSKMRPYVLRSVNRKLKWKRQLKEMLGLPLSAESVSSSEERVGLS
ncbi:unnamed protein product [Strongylus vulgaris]|uniref:Uncharacterized protein n=1 Tax=Strongylus vulgaris TaxID=40348 RepID=A0A3P7JBV3_STRVU|nr:unnamed protein product [Strongylus vulgaris]